MSSQHKNGLIQVYFGHGKGKTTAALGLAFRAAGRGFQVHVIQFMKGFEYGELHSAKKSKLFEITQFGGPDLIADPSQTDIEMGQAGLEFARKISDNISLSESFRGDECYRYQCKLDKVSSDLYLFRLTYVNVIIILLIAKCRAFIFTNCSK